MKPTRRHLPEQLFLAAVFLLAIAGFWPIFLGPGAEPDAHQQMHLVVVFAWLALLFVQLRLVSRQDFAGHRRLGAAVLVVAPLLVASTAMLAVHSANKGIVSGRGDPLVVQNMMGPVELGLLVFLAFLLRKRRPLHGALLMATAISFMGIALFFTLLGFVPGFRIEGPETFHRFALAGMTGQGICLAVGLAFLARDYRNGWPYLLAALFFPFNDLLGRALARFDLVDPLTRFLGSLSQGWTFVGGFALMLALLLATGLRPPRSAPAAPMTNP